MKQVLDFSLLSVLAIVTPLDTTLFNVFVIRLVCMFAYLHATSHVEAGQRTTFLRFPPTI